MLSAMPKYIYVQLNAYQGAPHPAPLKIRADSVEKIEKQGEGTKFVLKLGNTSVGEITHHMVVGWWIQEE